MKDNKTKVQKKVTKNAAKKELEKMLTEKFLEVVQNLGHDAGHIAEDISKASRTFAKKLSKKFSSTVGEASSKSLETKKEISNKLTKKENNVKKAFGKLKPVAQSVKVTAIESEDKAAKVILTSKTEPMAKKTASVTTTARIKKEKFHPASAKKPAAKKD